MTLEEELVHVIHKHFPDTKVADARAMGHAVKAVFVVLTTMLYISVNRMNKRNGNIALTKVTESIFRDVVFATPQTIIRAQKFLKPDAANDTNQPRSPYRVD